MSKSPPSESVTYFLQNWREGDPGALDKITDIVYQDLRRLAAGYLRDERADHTLGPTALVHEMFLKLESVRGIDWQGRGQFISVAAQMMRRILIDRARRRHADKRDVSRAEVPVEAAPDYVDVIAVDRALNRMKDLHPRHAHVTELRIFGGLTSAEVATLLNLSERSIERDWRFAKAWLQNELSGGQQTVAG